MNMRYPNFDLLRLLLAVEVAFVHGWAMTDTAFNWAGFIMAVPAFLAISGFLVLKSYEESGTWGVFIRKRALRLLPALLVSLILCWVLFDWFAVYNSLLNWVTGGLYTLPGVANGPLWSLMWEEIAYVCLALLWMAGAYKHRAIIWLLLAMSFAIVYWARVLDGHTQMILFLLPSFFIGNLAYLHRTSLLKVHPVIPWCLLFAVIFSYRIPYFGQLVQLSPVGFQAFAVVWVGMAGLNAAPFRFPDISYSVYIYHMPIVIYLIRHDIATTTSSMALWLPLPLLAICLASWYLVEKPALKLKPPGKTTAAKSATCDGALIKEGAA
ncbi:acyltransferase [Pseudomonas sp. SWRI111]|uniref:acyltransferase family protein n=1 Tax=Pseudomonas sp. SWRI111 TaxID=2745507 RepID=UPI0016450BD5|nr:acyltransferase [Pseudomonas sp. SWRI111]MBC3207667.1 acyltransferase [Pseudomonas sp. SWRI111]